MSGGGGGFDLNAFNPFDHWHDKRGLDKFASLAGLPIGSAIASPKWIKAHPKEAAAAAIVAASVFSGGAAAGLLGGGAAGGAAAGTTAAELGAGAGAFGGAALADGAALGAGAGAGAWGGAALADGAVPALAVQAPYAGELASVGESGGTMLGGAPAQSITPEGSGLLGKGKNVYDTLSRVQQLMKLTQGQQPQQTQTSQRPQAGPQTDPMEYLRRIYAMQNGGK